MAGSHFCHTFTGINIHGATGALHRSPEAARVVKRHIFAIFSLFLPHIFMLQCLQLKTHQSFPSTLRLMGKYHTAALIRRRFPVELSEEVSALQWTTDGLQPSLSVSLAFNRVYVDQMQTRSDPHYSSGTGICKTSLTVYIIYVAGPFPQNNLLFCTFLCLIS